MLEMGTSKPWLEVLTGQRQMDASAILDYFAPLREWLAEQNKSIKMVRRDPASAQTFSERVGRSSPQHSPAPVLY